METKFSLDILYEDSDCLFINKQWGISVHGDGKTPVPTLADLLIAQYPELKDVGEPLLIRHKQEEITVLKPGIVHRLDKETSGVMVIAKTQKAYDFLKKQFQEREIQKVYHAFVYGWIKEDTQTITGAIGRDPGNIRRWTVSRFARGTMREAITEVEVKKRFGTKPYEGQGSTEDGTYSFIEARPKTGRTHQIRVHLKYINHSIVSDSLYSNRRQEALGFTRLALHARSLTVLLPSGKTLTIEAPYPADFEKALKLAEA